MFFAPAKINLYLHITGRRADGYHDLDSLVTFASVGDEIRCEPSFGFSFILEGPQAAALRLEQANRNLAVKAAQSLGKLCNRTLDVTITLVKNLPVASGIGGGSSDAAATLRALAQQWGLSADDPRILKAAAAQGQDVPVCLKIANSYMTADGVVPGPELPACGIMLVNPNKALPTPDVYAAFREGGYAFSPEARLTEAPRDMPELVAALKQRGNDLYKPALTLMPEIGQIIAVLEAIPGCRLARMSGSGATCFGLFDDEAAAKQAASLVAAKQPGWWVAAAVMPVTL